MAESWLKQWRAFISGEKEALPGPISNASLLEDIDSLKPKARLEVKRDYRCVLASPRSYSLVTLADRRLEVLAKRYGTSSFLFMAEARR